MPRETLSRRRLLGLAGGTAALGLAGCTGDGADGGTPTATDGDTERATDTETETAAETAAETATEAAGPAPALSVADQEADGGAVTIPSATIDAAGWLVVHPEGEDGGPDGAVTLAERRLSAGEYGDVELTLEPLAAREQTVYAMLHYDEPADGEFTFPDEGDPAVAVDGEPVVAPFSVTAGGGTATVDLIDFGFDPRRLSVAPGTTVEWTNEDPTSHDVTSAQFHDAAEQWDLEADLSAGSRTSYTFESEGIYEYYCTIHGDDSMCGVVLVGEASLEADLPCEDSLGGGGY